MALLIIGLGAVAAYNSGDPVLHRAQADSSHLSRPEMVNRNINNHLQRGNAKGRHQRQLRVRPHNNSRYAHRINSRFVYPELADQIALQEIKGREDAMPHHMMDMWSYNGGNSRPSAKIHLTQEQFYSRVK